MVRVRRVPWAVVVVATWGTERLGEDIGDGRETVVRLVCGDVVNVRGLREVGGRVGELARWWEI